MRVGLIPENLLERGLMAAGLIPVAMTEAYAPLFGRAIAVAAEAGVFDAIGTEGRSAPDVAKVCGTDLRGTEKLLNLLVTMRYLQLRGDRYRLSRHARRWLLAGRGSAQDAIRMKLLEWEWIEGLDELVRTGRQVDVHSTMDEHAWRRYQRGMRAQANVLAPVLARLVPVPEGARTMLDIGGSHGYFSVALCRRHPGLSSVVLDLPQAVAHAAPLLEQEGMGDRVALRAGDALSDDLGEGAFDLVFMFSLVHHFDEPTNRALISRAARAIRPGGVMVIGDVIRPDSAARASQMGTFFDLYFALTSRSGLWSFDEMQSWQRDAGLRPRKARRLPFAAEIGLQVADRTPV